MLATHIIIYIYIYIAGWNTNLLLLLNWLIFVVVDDWKWCYQVQELQKTIQPQHKSCL